jgi:hypothetical protein
MDVTVGRHQLGRPQRVTAEPVLPRQPAEASPEGVADGPDVGGRTEQRREAHRSRRLEDGAPGGAAADGGGAGLGVDLDAHQPRQVDEHGAGVGHPGHPVAGGLDGDAQPLGAGVVDRRHHVGCGLGRHDDGGAVLEGEVPRSASGVVALVGGGDHLAGRPAAEQVERRAEVGGRGHVSLLAWSGVGPLERSTLS